MFLRLFKYLWPERYLPEPQQEDPFNEDPPPRVPGKVGVLLVNLGTPDTPTAKDIRKYLGEFLSDPRVIEIPRYLWKPILHGIVLVRRPKRLEPRYAGIWMQEGSPLMVYSKRQADGVRPPPPDEGGGLIGAIADALKSIGVDGGEETDAASTTSGTESDTANAAQALGSFLESLMGALHAQNGEEGAATPAYGEPPQGGPGMGGGPGKLSSDLQGLISALGNATGSTTATTDSTSTDDTSATDTDSSVSALQDSFKSLLTALGVDAADSGSKLSSFLQTLSAKLPSAGSSGNLIDTTA